MNYPSVLHSLVASLIALPSAFGRQSSDRCGKCCLGVSFRHAGKPLWSRIRLVPLELGSIFFIVAWTFNPTVVHAQAAAATRTTIAIPTDFALNMIQGSDGNLYSTSGTPDEGCQGDDPDNTQCSFIYKITPSGTISTFHAFQQVSTTLTGTTSPARMVWSPAPFLKGLMEISTGPVKPVARMVLEQSSRLRPTVPSLCSMRFRLRLRMESKCPSMGSRPIR